MMRPITRTLSVSIFLVSVCIFAQPGDEPFTKIYGVLKEDRQYVLYPLQAESGLVYETKVSYPGTKTLRLHFLVENPARENSWSLTLSGQRGELWSVTAAEIEGTEFWSPEFRGNSFDLKLFSTERHSPLRLFLDGMVVTTVSPTPSGITKPDNLTPIRHASIPDQYREWGQSVALIKFVRRNKKAPTCTGFLLGSQLLITNHHCISNEYERDSATVIFDFDVKNAKTTSYKVSEIVRADPGLDYSFLKLDRNTERRSFQLDATGPALGDSLLVIQHPDGRIKHVSKVQCDVTEVGISGSGNTLTDFAHGCDTLGGSSGSPVLNPASGKVVGLHHWGFDYFNDRLINQAVDADGLLQAIASDPRLAALIGGQQ